MPRRREARPFAPALRRAVERLGPKTVIFEVQMVWDDVVGPTFAGHTTPQFEKAGVITVYSPDAVRTQELELLSRRVIDALNDRLGRPAVKDLRIVSLPPGR